MFNHIQNPSVRYIPYITPITREIASIEVSTELLHDVENATYFQAFCVKNLLNTPVVLHDDKLKYFGGTKEQQDIVSSYHQANNLFSRTSRPLFQSEDEFHQAQTEMAMDGFLAV